MRRALGLLLPSLALASLASVSAYGCGGNHAAQGADGGDASAEAATHPKPDASDEYVYVPFDGAVSPSARVPVHAELVSNRAIVQELMFASGEMQTSGEPFAEFFAGRNLADYDRLYLPPDEYILNNGSATLSPIYVKDLFGFSTAVESYEYSKMYMNMLLEETTSGISLAYGPVTAQEPGATALAQLQARALDLLGTAGTDVQSYATLPVPVGNPANYLGFPGLWPEFAPYSDFDPYMVPSQSTVKSCSFQGGYGGLSSIGEISPAFECDYNTTHLPNPAAQENRVLVPAALGYTVWKEALWGIDFAGRVHDSQGNQINAVAPGDVSLIGTRTLNDGVLEPNTIMGTNPPGLAMGAYIGSSPVEGMWGLMMVANMDNLAEWMISSLMTSDGATLSGFPSKAQALAYDYTTTPLVWFPNAVAVTVDDTVQPYPPVTNLAITDGTSSSEALSALLLGNSLFFGMTDPRNVALGQRLGLQAAFDGDPFAAQAPGPTPDGGTPTYPPTGQDTPHDRALSMIRVAFIDLDRIHSDPTLGVILDSASISGGTVTRGTTLTTTTLAHSIIGMFQTFLGLNSAITQYGGANPDPALDAQGILNGFPVNPPSGSEGGAPPSFSRRVRQVFETNAAFLMNTLTHSDGSVVNGATISAGLATPTTTPATLDTQAAAVRALIVAYLATGDASYLTRGQAVVRYLLGPAFFSTPALMFRGVASGTDDVTMTPSMFAWLQSSLRETYKALYVPGDPLLDRSVLETRIARVNKLYVNGWDDLNGNQSVDYPEECLAGRLQLGEQALTGETGRNAEDQLVADRDHDCVLDIAYAFWGDGGGGGTTFYPGNVSKPGGSASTQAAQVHFHSP
jgi:hypothetical protein